MPIALIAAGVGAAGAIGSAVIGSSAANNAADTQANAENTAAADQLNMYNQTKAALAPYNTTGQAANAQIAAMPGFNGGPAFNFAPTEANLENTPGYQFNLYQGLKATQNSAAARGLGVSGAAEKGAATYASGLANSTYQNQFQNALSQYQTNYGNALNSYTTNLNKLQGQASLGENAAAQTGNYGTQTAQAIGQTAVGAANAQAAGTVGSANAIASGLNGIGNSFTSAAYLNSLNGGGGLYGGGSAYQAAGNASTFDQAGADQYGFDGAGYGSFAGS